MKRKIITISGKLGSGKSSAAKKLAKMLSLEHFSSGDFLREVAKERNLSIKDLMIAAETDSSVDTTIDDLLKEKANNDNLIIDSRLAYHWIPESFKVYLEIDPDIAAKRMFYDLETNESRQESEHSVSIEEMKKNMVDRHASDTKRYKELYNLDPTDHDNFDLVINTGFPENDGDNVVKKIIQEYLEWIKDTK